MTVNETQKGAGKVAVTYTLRALDAQLDTGSEDCVRRVLDMAISREEFRGLKEAVKVIRATKRFRDVVDTFKVPEGETPAGFRVESALEGDGALCVDLVRDISYDKNGVKRPTGLLFSADSANPYEVGHIAPLLANLTCNPGIVYDLFINNPEANVGGRFQTRDEVMTELGRVLGPGCDISVELNNPFEEDFDKILEECETFKKILSEYRLVVKVPHTGPVNGGNVGQLLEGNKRLNVRYDRAAAEDALRGHNLALKLREHGYRINFTLMFEPYQTALALQAKPYFINSFVRHRLKQTEEIRTLLGFYAATEDPRHLEAIRTVLIQNDYLSKDEEDADLLRVLKLAKDVARYRGIETPDGADGLDSVRHNLRLLRDVNLADTRLIICSMEGDYNYPDIDNLMADPDYADVVDRIVITAEPGYLARFASANQVVSYQRRFMNAARGQK
ncbi:MAG: transaldolase [Peptococcaceae bacterium]|jgi:hypothetical protein|nr:transaldolase [Peptococcaceae bacterium]